MYGTYTRLRVHVWASDIAVIRAASKKLQPAARYCRKNRVSRHKFYRLMLDYHHNEQRFCAEWRM